MNDSIDPVEFYDGMFDPETKQFLKAFGDKENRAMFAYIAENGETHIDEVYDFLSESETIEDSYEDFSRADVRDIRSDMHQYVRQRSAVSDLDLDEVYFELSAMGEEVAEGFNVGNMLK